MKTNSSLANYYYSQLPKAQVGTQTTTNCPEGFQWNAQRNVCTTPDGRTFEELKADNDAAWGNVKTALATGAALGAGYAARNHPLVTSIPAVVKEGAYKDYGEALAMEAFEKGSYPFAKLPGLKNIYKGAAKIVGSQSGTPDRELKQILKGLISGKEGVYAGANQVGGRSALNNYIYGDASGYDESTIPYRNLEKYEERYGKKFKTYALNDQFMLDQPANMKSYFSNIQYAVDENNKLIYPELYDLKGEELSNAIKNLIKREGTIGVGSNTNLIGSDDIAGHMLYFDHDPKTDQIHLTTQDINKFTPDDYGKKWLGWKSNKFAEHVKEMEGTSGLNLSKNQSANYSNTSVKDFLKKYSKYKQVQMMERSGTPFVLNDKRPVVFPTPAVDDKILLPLDMTGVDIPEDYYQEANKLPPPPNEIYLNINDDAVKYEGPIYKHPNEQFGIVGPTQPTESEYNKLLQIANDKKLTEKIPTTKLNLKKSKLTTGTQQAKLKIKGTEITPEVIANVLKNKVYSNTGITETPRETKEIEGFKTEEGLNTLKNLLGNFIKFGKKAKEEYGGDISIPNVYPNQMNPKMAYGGPLVDYYQGKMNGPNMFGPGGQTTDGCPPYYKKHPTVTGLCIPDGQMSDEQKKLIGLPVTEQQGPTVANVKKLNDAIGRNSINKIVAQQKANGTYIQPNQGQQAQFNVYDEAKARQGQLIHDEQMRLQAQANSDLSQTMGSFTPQQYADYTSVGGAGSIGANTQLAATALPVAASSVAIAAPAVAAGLQAPLLGTLGTQYGTAALTANNLIGAGFFYKGAKNLPNVSNAWKSVYENPTLGNIGDAAAETGVTTLDMLPFVGGALKGVPSVLQDVNMFGNWAAKNAPGKDLLVAGALSKRLAFGKPRFNVETPAFAKRIDPIGRSSVNAKNDFLKEMSPEEYDQFVKSIYDKIGYAYDQPFVEFKSSKPISFMQGVGIDPTGSQREAMLLKEKFCAPGSECAKSANAVTNRLFTDITGQPFDALGNAHNAWHMEDQMTRNGAINLRGRFPLKVGDRILMGNNVNQSTYVPGYTADSRVRHAGVFAGMHQTPSGDVFPMLFESGKNSPLYLNPTQSTFTGPNTILEAIRPQQFLDNTFGEALVDKNIRYAFRDKLPVANFNSDNPAVQKLLTDAEPFRETIKRSYDITNDEFNELLNSLVSIGGQETKLNGLLPGSKLAKAKIQLQNTLNRFDLLKPIKQGVNLVKQTMNSGALPTDFRLPAYPGASRIEMEAAIYANKNDVPFESAVRQIKSQYQPKPKFSLSTIEPSKGLFRQKYQTETDRLSNFGSDIKSKNSIENGLGQMSENYNKVKNMYPDATPRQLMDITTLMWNSPGKALNTELVDFYVFGKNNPNPAKFNFDYINKVNKFKDRYINVKPQLVDPHLDILQNGKYPVIQYAQGGQPPVNPNGMYDGVRDWRIPGGNITMENVPFPVVAYPSNSDEPTLMQPGENYTFPNATHVDEYPAPQFKKGPQANQPLSGLDWTRAWVSDPKFKDRLVNMGVQNPEEEQARRLSVLDQYKPKTYRDLRKEQGFGEWLRQVTSTTGVSYGTPDTIYVKHRRSKRGKIDEESTRVHELKHLLEQNGARLTPENNTALQAPFTKRNVLSGLIGSKQDQEYYTDPTEISARISQAQAYYGLTPDQEFTEEMYEDMKRRKNWFGLRPYLKDKKGFINLVNKYAVNEPSSKNMDMAKYGGGLLSRTVTCSGCGHSWKGVDGGEDVMTCHKCGGTIKMKQGGVASNEGYYNKGMGIPKFQVAGGVNTPPQDPRSQKFYNTLDTYFSNSTNPDDKGVYQAFKKFNDVHGYAPVNVNRKNIMGNRPMTNPFTGSLNLINDENPYAMMDQYMAEYPHYQQYNEHPERSRFRKSAGFLGKVFNDYGVMFKNLDRKKTLGDLGHLRFRKVGEDFSNAYEKNYETPGTTEYQAHEVMEPKNWDELKSYIPAKNPSLKNGGGPGDGILDNIYAKWPALKKLGNVTIKPDESFTRDRTGVGDIEFFGPNTPQVTYNNGYVAQNPGAGGYGILYNPFTNDEQNVRLDMLHGMPEVDNHYRRLRNRFERAVGHTDIKNEMNHWYNQALQKGEAQDGKQQWMDNYTDGQLRTLLFEGDRAKQNYSDDEANQLLSHPRVKRKFNKINNYLKKGKDGGQTNFKNNSPLLEFYYSKTKR
jgi:hypothetical protein